MSLERCGHADDKLLERIKLRIRGKYDIYHGDRDRSTSGQLCRAKKERKNSRNNSFKLRQEYLEKLVDKLHDNATQERRTRIIKGIKDTESRKRMYALLRRYLNSKDRAGLHHVDVPEWDQFEFALFLCWTAAFQHVLQIQMWMATACLTMFLLLTPWYEMFLDIIQYRRVVIRDKMEAALFRQHVWHFSQAMGTPFTT